MKLKSGILLSSVSIVLVSLSGLVAGCAQADNPTPTAAPAPPAPTAKEVALPKVGGKEKDYSANPRYKKMQDNMAKQSGSPPPQ
jgi:heat shock protein HslJ